MDKIIEKDLGNGILEAEGSEEFVQEQLDELWDKFIVEDEEKLSKTKIGDKNKCKKE